MRSFQSVPVRNRLLGALAPDDFARLAPKLERIPTALHATIIAANTPTDHVVFPESGIVSTIAKTEEGRIEIGVIGFEGMVGIPVVLGTDRSRTATWSRPPAEPCASTPATCAPPSGKAPPSSGRSGSTSRP